MSRQALTRSAFIVLSAILLTQQGFAQPRVFQCVGPSGERVFQDSPCGLAQNPWQSSAVERNRWVQVGTACRVHSPLAPLFFESQGERITLKGGVRLELIAAESGIRANLVLNAAWPTEAAATDSPASGSEPTSDTSTLSQGGAGLAAPEAPSIVQAKLLELSGDISQHEIVASSGQRYGVDSMLDPRRMAYGYRQTGVITRVLRGNPDFFFRVTLRSPAIALQSTPLESTGLSNALVALSQCVKSRQPANRLAR